MLSTFALSGGEFPLLTHRVVWAAILGRRGKRMNCWKHPDELIDPPENTAAESFEESRYSPSPPMISS